MRIVFISPHCDPQATLGEPDAGGQCVYEHDLAMSLARSGYEVITFCRQRNNHQSVTRVIPGYTIYRLRAGGTGFVPKENIERLLPEFTAKVHQTLIALQSSEETVIHSHYWDGVATALMYKAAYQDIPMVWTPHSLGFIKRDKFHGISQESNFHFIARLNWENYGAIIADQIIVSTKDEKRKLHKYYSVLNKRIFVVPPGVNVGSKEYENVYRAKWQIPIGAHVLLTVGRIARSKGYHHAIRILHLLNRSDRNKYFLVIVGGSSAISSREESQYFEFLHRLVSQYGLENNVIFQPSVPHHEIQSIYALANIYLMTSEDEPFGLTTIEAMASGITVIAHKEGGTKNILTHGVTGYTVDMHRYADVTRTIEHAINNPLLRERIGIRAQNKVAADYSWSSRLPEFMNVYQNAIEQKRERLAKLMRTDVFLQRNVSFV